MAGQVVKVKWHLYQHALLEIAYSRHKQRPPLQPGQGHDFWNVFVLKAQRIKFEQRCIAMLVGINHGIATT